MRVAIIPARGGSKRIPRKNIRAFAGKPIIAYSIEAALRSGLFERTVVSTDDDEIAEVARAFGAEVPFIRPAQLADDVSGTHGVIGHAVRWLIDRGTSVDQACCIYPTAPLIAVEDIARGLDTLDRGWDTVVAATTFPYPVFRAVTRTAGGGVRMIFPEHYRTRSQDLPEALHDAGQFYWSGAETWMAPAQGFTDRTTVVVLPRWRVQDIDTIEDWQRAEIIYRLMNELADRPPSEPPTANQTR
jgi:N-acylneuraminate cytidylyltransferase